MRAVRARLRADLRNRWVAWLAVALAIGLAGAVVITAAAGARRTGTAFERFRAESHSEDLYISAGSAKDPDVAKFDDELEALPQVERAGRVAAMNVYSPDPDLNVQTPYQFAGIDRRYGNAIDRPNVVSGRRPNPKRPDEALINRALARASHLGVGDTLDWIALTTAQTEQADIKPSDGEKVHLKVVGIGVYPNEVVATAQYDSLPFAYLTPAFFKAHRDQSQDYGFEIIRLRHGKDDVPAFRTEMTRLLRKHGADPRQVLVSDRSEPFAQVERAIRPQSLALGAFAILAGVVFLLVVGQVLTRQIYLDSDDYPTLRAMGMTRGDLFTAAMVRVGVISVVGALVAVIAAALASPLMPIGPARLAEPHPGFAINVAILGPGFLAIVVLFVAVAAYPAWRAARSAGHEPVRVRARRERASRAFTVAGAGLAPTSVIGIRAALRPGRGRTSVPVRSVLITSGLAIAAVVAAFTFTSNLDHLSNTPRLYGWDWTFKAGNGFFPVHAKATSAKLSEDRDVAAFAGANYGDLRIAGRTVASIGLDSIRGSIFPTLLEGRAPRNNHEIVLGTRTLHRAGLSVGDQVKVVAQETPRSMRIVGRAVFPKLGAGSFTPTNLGEGAATRAAVFADRSAPADDKYSFMLFRLKPGTDMTAAQKRLQQTVGPMDFCGGESTCVETAERPGDLSNYTRVRGTPLLLAAVLALMAIGALGHVLVTSVRRRRRDTAVLKTLGFVRRQVSAVTAWQATTMAAVALLIGIPVGILLGRVAWATFADALGVGPASLIPAWALLLAIPATIVLANLIAAIPALLSARTHPAVVLRSE
jgi:ABC-type lipoprotein release transport system permease subunit